MNDIDAKDFLILNEIYRTKSVTAAVEKVGLGQPSISIRLGRLRKHFNDPLFVRTSTGMQPTPRMDGLISAIGNALTLFDGSAGVIPTFDPAISNRAFRICMTDTGQVVILPRLLAKLKDIAPMIRIELINLTSDAARLLEAGEVDIAMGFPFDMPSPFYQQKLFDEHFVCIVGANHPRIKNKMTEKLFLSERHIEVNLPKGNGHGILAKAMEENGAIRNFALQLPSFLGVARIVAHSELVSIVPAHLGRLLAEDGHVKVMEAPIPLPVYPVKQYWHERYHHTPANKWLRSLVANLFIE
ncbi:LysR family transcriptional regulator [Herminiimonas contaminans]|uniref:LysR family transcriptional regulator n=1 Tax=Herminiimonas contaminans TaxID=1111140 RepID=A0ABS0ETP7_9BURK|nr:LysR family transcriptional regulator [Herminiimonas contaminans]MBF8178216.1 LysR family transcriptional regulator [Herminiimonas contaminans]